MMHSIRRLPCCLIVILLLAHSFEVESFELVVSQFDRFRFACPANVDTILQFDPSLLEGSPLLSPPEGHVWVAVYRANNNQPSVLVQDEFLHAMRSATTPQQYVPQQAASTDNNDASIMDAFSPVGKTGVVTSSPVAVARLRPSDDHQNTFILDSMRCILVKENTDPSCDGGSEHTEALATAIDALLHYYLVSVMTSNGKDHGFENSIQTKATLISAPLLEDRGFRPITELTKEMVTHTSSLDDCLQRYAARSISSSSVSSGIRQRAIEIVSQLGRIDRAVDMERARQYQRGSGGDDDQPKYNPWASPFF